MLSELKRLPHLVHGDLWQVKQTPEGKWRISYGELAVEADTITEAVDEVIRRWGET